jgi:stage II sporulation protein AA (anti-sigma F factor antagonist)
MKISSDYSSGSLVVRMSGELDHHGARPAMRTIDGLIDEYLPRDTVLNLSGLTFMDSSGIALILKVERRMREAGGRIFLEAPAKQPLRVIDASGIDRMIAIREERA